MKHAYLLGQNITHSKSPEMYRALFAHYGLDWTYDLHDIATAQDVEQFVARDDWLFLNITTPFKQLAASLAGTRAASAQLSGGANLLVRQQGTLLALNNDGVGAVRSMQRAGISFEGARVVVCGTGPTARAICAHAALAGAGRLALVGRDRDRAKQAVEELLACYKELAYGPAELAAGPVQTEDKRSFRDGYEQPGYVFGSYATSTNEIAQADILIDATPLGMQPGDQLPFSADLLEAQSLVFDVVYGHGTTPLLAAASRAGCKTLDGKGMLVAQAVENAGLLLALQGVEESLSWDATFDLLAQAAQFAC